MLQIQRIRNHSRDSMAQRRKIEVSATDDKLDFGLDFQTVANEVAKLYQEAVNLQPVSFDAGRRHSLMKVHDWILSQMHDGKTVTSADVIAYVQNEINELLLTNPALAQSCRPNHSGTTEDMQVEVNAVGARSTASIENQGPGANVPQEMEEDPPYM